MRFRKPFICITMITIIIWCKIMLVDLNLAGREVLVVGGGSVGERKVCKFLSEGCSIVVGSKDFTDSLKRLGEEGKVKLVEVDAGSDPALLERLVSRADIVVAATDDRKTNEEIANQTKNSDALVCVVDSPSDSDFSLAATTNVGGIQIAIYTKGKSPAMARLLRERIEKTITKQDLLQVELQSYARSIAKARISDQKLRKDVVYQILYDSEVNILLEKGLFREAKAHVERIIDQY